MGVGGNEAASGEVDARDIPRFQKREPFDFAQAKLRGTRFVLSTHLATERPGRGHPASRSLMFLKFRATFRLRFLLCVGDFEGHAMLLRLFALEHVFR